MNNRQILRRDSFTKHLHTHLNLFKRLTRLKSTRLAPTYLTRVHTNILRHIRRMFSVTTIRSIIIIKRHSMLAVHNVRTNILNLNSTTIFLVSRNSTTILHHVLVTSNQTKVLNPVIRRGRLGIHMQLLRSQVGTMARMIFNIVRQRSSKGRKDKI